MATFGPGTSDTITLDDWDVLTIVGVAKVQISVTGQSTFETQTYGTQELGPYGTITTVALRGIGVGSYTAGPSNVAVPLHIVDLSAEQVAAPTVDMLQAPATLFRLNEAPYTIYSSTGSALSSGSTVLQQGSLVSDETKAPNAAAVASAISAIPQGTIAPTSTQWAAGVISLDLVNGRDYGAHQVTTTETITYAGAVQNGNAQFCLQGDGTHSPDLSAFSLTNGYVYDATSGAQNIYSAYFAYATPLLKGETGASTDDVAPTVTSASIPAGDATRVDLVFSEACNSTLPAAASFATATHTYTSLVSDDSTHAHLVTSTTFVGGETAVLAYTAPGSDKLKDLAGNNMVNFTGKAITNNLATYDQQVAADTPLAYFKCENSNTDSGQTATDSSGNSVAATWWSGTTAHQTPIWGTGYSVGLSGGAGGLQTTGDIFASSYSGSLSYVVNFSTTSAVTKQGLGGRGLGSWSVGLEIQTDGSLKAGVRYTSGATVTAITSAGVISANTPYEAALVLDKNTGLYVYLNGVQVAFTADTAHLVNSVFIPSVGEYEFVGLGHITSTTHLLGKMQRASWYGTVLSPDRILAYYNARAS